MCAMSDPPISPVPTSSIDLPVLFLDDHLVAVDKPPGMPVQPDPTGDTSLLELVSQRFANGGSALGLVHRLDRPVSGVVVFARSPEALALMNALFQGRSVVKHYRALVEGQAPSEGRCTGRLEHDARRNRARVTGPGEDHVLRFRRLAQGDRFALLEVEPAGGAFHQIRALLGASGMPIKGDVKYGARRGEPDRSIGLHAHRLAFAHPITEVPVNLEAAAPTRNIWPALLALVGL